MQEGASIIRKYAEWMNDDQKRCYNFLCDMSGGSHHVYEKVHPVCDFGIKINTQRDFATYDFDLLTQIVIMAHKRAIRVEFSGSGPNMVKLLISVRQHDKESKISYYERHPSLEDLIIKCEESLKEDAWSQYAKH